MLIVYMFLCYFYANLYVFMLIFMLFFGYFLVTFWSLFVIFGHFWSMNFRKCFLKPFWILFLFFYFEIEESSLRAVQKHTYWCHLENMTPQKKVILWKMSKMATGYVENGHGVWRKWQRVWQPRATTGYGFGILGLLLIENALCRGWEFENQ